MVRWGRSFKKGSSGNPRGRPKRDFDLAAIARDYTDEAIGTLVDIMTDNRAPASARVQAASAVLDRGYGRAPQSLTVEHQLSFGQEFEKFLKELNSGPPQPLRQCKVVGK